MSNRIRFNTTNTYRSLGVLTFLCCVFSVFGQTTYYDTINHEGTERSFIVYVPESYSIEKSSPLLINFHDQHQYNYQFFEQADFRKTADTSGCILIYPQALKTSLGVTAWNADINNTAGVDDIGFVRTLIDSLRLIYNINNERIYATGFGSGAFLCFSLVCELQNIFAAIAPVKGKMTELMLETCSTNMPMPILCINNDKDKIASFSGKNPVDSTIKFWLIRNNNVDTLVTNLKFVNTGRPFNVRHFKFIDSVNHVNVNLIKEYQFDQGASHNYPVSKPGSPWYFDSPTEIWKYFLKYDKSGIRNTASTSLTSTKPTVKFYPNPTSNYLNIVHQYQGNSDYSLFNTAGELLSHDQIWSNTFTLDLTNFPNAIYFLQINNHVYRVVKMN